MFSERSRRHAVCDSGNAAVIAAAGVITRVVTWG
jgi:hypothetical protein